MALSGQSLNAVTSTGPGTAIMFDVPKAFLGVQITTTGSPATATVAIEFTINGTDWVSGPAAQVNSPFVGVGASNGFGPALGLRANLTALAGGTSPTVSAWVAAA